MKLRITSQTALLILLLACAPLAASGAAVGSDVDGKSLIAAAPADPSGYLQYAQWLQAGGDLEQAIATLETGRQKAEPSAELLVELGRLYEADDRISRAETVTREALALDAGYAPAHIRMGEIYMHLGWPKSGVESFEAALALQPEQSLPKVRIVGGLLAWGKIAEAEDRCLEFIAGDAEDPELWLALGQVFEKQDKLREAFTTYGQVLSLQPDLAEAHARRGRLFCRFGQYAAGEEACRQALVHDADNLTAHAYLGIACSYLGQGDEARKHAAIAEAGGLNMTAVWKKLDN
jgi:tetratricopeptide (TPR) repeat protein